MKYLRIIFLFSILFFGFGNSLKIGFYEDKIFLNVTSNSKNEFYINLIISEEDLDYGIKFFVEEIPKNWKLIYPEKIEIKNYSFNYSRVIIANNKVYKVAPIKFILQIPSSVKTGNYEIKIKAIVSKNENPIGISLEKDIEIFLNVENRENFKSKIILIFLLIVAIFTLINFQKLFK